MNIYIQTADSFFQSLHPSLSPLDQAQYGSLYFRSSKLISFMTSSLCPKDIISNLLLGIKWLLRDAVEQSGKSEFLGADLMFPILVLVLIHANIPTMHLILHFLQSFSAVDNYGEAAYYVTCLEAAVLFIDRMEPPQKPPRLQEDRQDDVFKDCPLMPTSGKSAVSDESAGDGEASDGDGDGDCDRPDDPGQNDNDEDDNSSGRVAVSVSSPREDEKAIKKLGEWIRDQQTMEEAITILQQQGWMV